MAALIVALATVGKPSWAQVSVSSGSTTKPAQSPSEIAGIQWVTISSGTFMMGSGIGDEGPAHRVTIKSFQMARTLATNKQYKACVAARACTPAQDYGAIYDGDDQPVVGVDWNQAKTFSKWVGGRLPSEAEWEYAARSGGKKRKYPWGDEEPTCGRAVVPDCGYDVTAPVCSKPKGNTEQGLCDMAGNAWEWVEDYYHESYNGAPTDGSAWEDRGFYRVSRGGSWIDIPARTRSADHDYSAPTYRGGSLGFRPVR